MLVNNWVTNVGPLQDNGGPTQTIALLAGSSAIDFIPLNVCLSTTGQRSTTDQRDMPRPEGNHWEEDTISGDCKFIHRAYDINTHQLEWCPAMATDFTNFIYEVQMKIVTGDGGGIAFRIDPKTGQQYHYFAINQDGSYSIQANDIVLASGSSSAIDRGLNQTNLIAAVVHGPVIELYVCQSPTCCRDKHGSR